VLIVLRRVISRLFEGSAPVDWTEHAITIFVDQTISVLKLLFDRLESASEATHVAVDISHLLLQLARFLHDSPISLRAPESRPSFVLCATRSLRERMCSFSRRVLKCETPCWIAWSSGSAYPATRPARNGAGCLPAVAERVGRSVYQGCYCSTGSIEVAAVRWLDWDRFGNGNFEIVR
jgi:hypothetical protein